MHKNASTFLVLPDLNFSKLSKLGLFLLIFWTHLLSTSGFGSDFHSPRTAALGGAGHAGPSLNDAIYLNPSYTSFLQTYSISYTFLRFNSDDLNSDGTSVFRGRNMNLSLQDGRSELFQAGVGYTRRDQSNLLTIGASKALLEQFGIGMGGKFLFPVTPGAPVVRSQMLSMTFNPTDWVQFSAIADNFIETDAGKAHGFYRELILGSKLNLQNILMIYFDPHWTPTLPGQVYGYELGAELGMFQDFFLRAGTFKNAAIPHQYGIRGRGYGFGAGWVAPRISLDYAVSHGVEPTTETIQFFGATIFF